MAGHRLINLPYSDFFIYRVYRNMFIFRKPIIKLGNIRDKDGENRAPMSVPAISSLYIHYGQIDRQYGLLSFFGFPFFFGSI